MKKTKLFIFTGILGFCSILLAEERVIVALRIEGMINPIISDYVEDGLTEATAKKSPFLLIELDTPGGLLDTTRTLIQSMLNADIPVVVYVTPRGARATSAGVFITMAADVAAMAPDTHIGAAHPVTITGEGPTKENEKETKTSAMSEKMVSDAAAYIRTLATEKGRNAVWAEKAVRESVSLTADEALKEEVIDLVVPSREELFKRLEGKTIKKNNKTFTLSLANVVVKDVPMGQFRKWLQMLAHPNVAYILITIGVYGLIYELAAPGIGLGGAVGVICLLLAFFSLQVLPVSAVGLALMGLGVILLVLELLNPTHGLLTFGGLIAFALGSFFLIDVKENPHYARISLELIISTVGTTALFFGVVLRKTLQAKRAKPKTGAESLIGQTGEAQSEINLRGTVFLNGELWTAESNEPIERGARVTVKKLKGNTLFVSKS